ncbi:isoleucine--tRNA ligase [Verrucomicrobiaceae bacterium 5K15]|uniref:Isoleucine--tRNA ligase n=1 Tax=Oceaniferula flava TaxID=2800421 RepID=A0AAE2SBY0_9BACT|nr:isoleucine--tRNA ligase [Oceaniferula flavus]MBK1853461.1 isoleucine--tRNA ligase [Oceaniferula flavus]MBM1134766.1 isoleucine--tRNA ligase [Oceaniferula flavus]
MSADESKNQPDYKATLSLPETSFPMRGDLVKNEPKRLERWNQENLYQRIQQRRKDSSSPRFLLHDGPPFANGDVHMGTALNKVLKDLVLKSKTMAGFETPYIPGWDCHGLPIEFKVMQDARDEEPAEIRRRCEEFARGWIDTQKASFRRLGVLGDWENPYLTLDPAYESDIIRTFATMVEKGLVYQSQKPVQWSYGAKTALAEAEVEYQDKKSIAIFVKFDLVANDKLPADTSFAIWTTTPWTLPANLGIAVHERFNYVVGRFTKEDTPDQNIIIVRELLEEFQKKTGLTLAQEIAEIKGAELEGLEAQHPFLDRTSKVILAPFVTTDTGTGAVHIAPGHGADDYSVGMQNGLAVLSPVDDDGRFTEEVGVPELVGLHVMEKNEGNVGVLRLLAAKGALLGKETYAHSYPHCWRSKTPIIFRAVEQFFIRIDDLRKKALSEIDETTWLPAWGRNRIFGTVEARPDWCISRQRTWGVPLPVFFDKDGEVILDAEISRKVADLVEEEGTNIWFELSDAELAARLGLPEGATKCRDTLDVWIDSGSSHVAVMDRHPELSCPADLYLEATDQHRGWFQSSLMLSVAVRDKAPYKSVLTHGFVVDKDGGKISKSAAKAKGKPTDAAHFYNKYGADIVRLWVSSVDWQTEVPFGEDLFKQIADPYRRLRNTLRILLGNINGFDPASQSVSKADMTVLDRWVLERLNEVIAECRNDYESYQFRKVFNQINQFCANELSALYIDITKDRMYCDGLDSTRRLAAQTVMYRVFDSIVRLMAPILAFTADEAWEHAGNEGSVHEQDFPEVDAEFAPGEAIETVNALLEIRAVIQTAIEEQVQAKAFNKNNEADVTLTLPADHPCAELLNDRDFVTEFFILSKLTVENGAEITATAKATDHGMCPRCRRYEPLVTDLCQRCSEVV